MDEFTTMSKSEKEFKMRDQTGKLLQKLDNNVVTVQTPFAAVVAKPFRGNSRVVLKMKTFENSQVARQTKN